MAARMTDRQKKKIVDDYLELYALFSVWRHGNGTEN